MKSIVVLSDGTVGKCFTFYAVVGQLVTVEYQDENGNLCLKKGRIIEILTEDE